MPLAAGHVHSRVPALIELYHHLFLQILQKGKFRVKIRQYFCQKLSHGDVFRVHVTFEYVHNEKWRPHKHRKELQKLRRFLALPVSQTLKELSNESMTLWTMYHQQDRQMIRVILEHQ